MNCEYDSHADDGTTDVQVNPDPRDATIAALRASLSECAGTEEDGGLFALACVAMSSHTDNDEQERLSGIAQDRIDRARALLASTAPMTDPRDARIAELEAENAKLRTELAAAAEKASQFVVGGRATEAWLAEVTAERDRLREALQLAEDSLVEQIGFGRVYFTKGPITERWDERLAAVRAALRTTDPTPAPRTP